MLLLLLLLILGRGCVLQRQYQISAISCVVDFHHYGFHAWNKDIHTYIHRSFCQFRRTIWTLLLVISLLLLRDFGTLFHWTVELLHPLTHLRSVLRHFFSIRHNRTVARASVLWRDINWLIDWLIHVQYARHCVCVVILVSIHVRICPAGGPAKYGKKSVL